MWSGGYASGQTTLDRRHLGVQVLGERALAARRRAAWLVVASVPVLVVGWSMLPSVAIAIGQRVLLSAERTGPGPQPRDAFAAALGDDEVRRVACTSVRTALAGAMRRASRVVGWSRSSPSIPMMCDTSADPWGLGVGCDGWRVRRPSRPLSSGRAICRGVKPSDCSCRFG